MRVVTPLDLRRRLGELLDAASAGERFLIERNGKPLAMLISVEDARSSDPEAIALRAQRLAALDRLDAFQRRMEQLHPRDPDEVDIVEWLRRDRSRDDPDGYPKYPEDDPERAARWEARYRAARERGDDGV
jgi:prevent-host-death family protein